ncbi:GroES-like protein [Pleomassaria siparia CBS 279.74]|uniref:GroES-like protein n=1 Tax=Pleomassaria siparia CBS 279.74 TaxID=1314801 RepID=A0A6G1JTL3_9PLEO|nr:GroES-like protein [Pleomassaria siparia CBS 279.74]
MVSWQLKWRRRSLINNTLQQSNTVEEIEEIEDVEEVKEAEPRPDDFHHVTDKFDVPETQSALLLHAIREPYKITSDYPVPQTQGEDELLVKVTAVGLNPIDWKAPDYNFGIPVLPYISGRELVGIVLQPPSSPSHTRIRAGDLVTIPSTDYRDLRRAAFQEYSIASSFNTIRLPTNTTPESGAILGVAFVAAVLALGICMGVSFEGVLDGPDLLKIVQGIDAQRLPSDIRDECLNGIGSDDKAHKDDFLVIWGGSSTCAFIMKQLARLVGLKIISVVDSGKHGLRLSNHDKIRPDLLVDSHDPERAISVIRAATGHKARFGFDTQGKESAAHLLRALASNDTAATLPKDPQEYEAVKSKLPTPPSTPSESAKTTTTSHLVGLTGVPKTDIPNGVALHSIPIKLFHEIPEVGEALSEWCERLLARGLLVPPDVVGTVEGLEGINDGLDRLRRREISGGRLVAVWK